MGKIKNKIFLPLRKYFIFHMVVETDCALTITMGTRFTQRSLGGVTDLLWIVSEGHDPALESIMGHGPSLLSNMGSLT